MASKCQETVVPGIRIGVQAVTSRGMKEKEIKKIDYDEHQGKRYVLSFDTL
jgi:hypothetical protein